MKTFSILCIICLLPLLSFGQYHQKGTDGRSGVKKMNNNLNPNAVVPTNGVIGHTGFGIENRSIRAQQTAHLLTEQGITKAREAGVKNVRINQRGIPVKPAKDWGRTENHPDGTYTETIFDQVNQQGDNFVIQRTRKPSLELEDPIIMTRRIFMDEMGRPREVQIFDSRGEYQYHGLFVYDPYSGKIMEQQIRDKKGTPLRRIVQKYDSEGVPLPLENYDYVKNLPKDLKLVVSNLDNELMRSQLMNLENEARQGLFNRNKSKWEKVEEFGQEDNQLSASGDSQAPSSSAVPAKEGSRKKFQLFRR